jgi:ABC-type Fe3+-hydroxamate transport system substrate-binding protein
LSPGKKDKILIKYGLGILSLLLIMVFAMSCTSSKEQDKDRYVVLSPEVAEILASLGIEDRIVGLTTECTYPPSLAQIHKVGAFGAVKVESVIALKPGIVFVSGLEQDGLAQDLTRLGFRVERVYPTSVDDIFTGIERIGEITDTQVKAQELIRSMQQEIAAIRAQNQGKSIPKVYLEIYRDPLMSVADNSFVGELIEIAGGNNVFDALERDYSRVKAEDVITSSPDIMICYSQDSLANITSRKGWQVIPAIRDTMIFFEDDIDPDLIQRAGPRIIRGLRELSAIYDKWREHKQ